MSVDSAKKAITACHILAWQWGWGLEQPIMAPLFSKIYWVSGERFNSHTDIKSTPPHHTLWKQYCYPSPNQRYTSPSQTCTQGYWAPSSSVTEAHASMTARISGTDMSGSVTSDQGWKHMTLLGSEDRNDRDVGNGC